jgi:hypothetical protein
MISAIAFATIAVLGVGTLTSGAVFAMRAANERRRQAAFPYVVFDGLHANEPRKGMASSLLDIITESAVHFGVSTARIQRILATLNVRFIDPEPATGGPYVFRNGMKLAGWNETNGPIVVVCARDVHVSKSAFVHEILHALALRIDGDADAGHKRDDLWALERLIREI